MLDSYRRVLRRPGAVRFSSAAVVARLPISMVSLGIVLLVEARTGSYGLAGTVSAAYVLAQAAAALLHGRLLDTLGQDVVLPAAISAFSASLSLMMLSLQLDWSLAAAYLLAALAGASLPQVGASVRTRWAHLLADPREVQTAFALESVLDEVVFMAGPVLVTALATTWHPVAGLAVAVATGLLGTLLYAAQRTTQPPPRGRRTKGPRPPMPWAVVGPLAVVSLAQGALFGAAEVVVIAFADEQGSPGAAGVLLACWALGSLVAGLATGAVVWRRSPAFRVRVGMAALACAMVPPVLVTSVPSMTVVMVVGGLAIAPTLIATLTAVERAVPPGRLTEGMAVLHTGLVAGVAPGAAAAGFVVDHHSASPAFWVAVAAGAVGMVASLLVRHDTAERPTPRTGAVAGGGH
ncbi:MFS transporter [Nocardioides solisilvae]|uniref:MFS transporter n=1 Tax=Nocardioides solisilvae TaxID=1542435 RepID=UPI000D744E40|nr:MFS transporter [Nocardioides solisilvae]